MQMVQCSSIRIYIRLDPIVKESNRFVSEIQLGFQNEAKYTLESFLHRPPMSDQVHSNSAISTLE